MKTKKNKIAGYRVYLGMTQKDTAKYLRISPQSYSHKENGYRAFNDHEKVKLKTLFQRINPDITIDEIFF